MKTFEKAWFITDWDPFDAAFNSLRCGKSEVGDVVRIWCQDEGRHIVGVLHYLAGCPAIKERDGDSNPNL